MVEGVGVSDEQLDETGLRAIEGSDHMRMAGQFGHDPDGWFRGTVRALVGEVRASHAREAELRAAVESAESARAHTVVLFSESTEALKRYALEGERDVLQQRIDKAEAEYRELRRRITTVHCWTNEDGRQFLFADDVRAALTGTGDTE